MKWYASLFVAKARQAKEVLAHHFICRAKEQRDAVHRDVRLRNRVGVSLLDCNRMNKNMMKFASGES